MAFSKSNNIIYYWKRKDRSFRSIFSFHMLVICYLRFARFQRDSVLQGQHFVQQPNSGHEIGSCFGSHYQRKPRNLHLIIGEPIEQSWTVPEFLHLRKPRILPTWRIWYPILIPSLSKWRVSQQNQESWALKSLYSYWKIFECLKKIKLFLKIEAFIVYINQLLPYFYRFYNKLIYIAKI